MLLFYFESLPRVFCHLPCVFCHLVLQFPDYYICSSRGIKISLCDELVNNIISFLSPSDLRKMTCVSKKHGVIIKFVAMKLSITKCDANIRQSIIQNESSAVSLYEKLLQGPCIPKLFHRRAGKGVNYSPLNGVRNASSLTHNGLNQGIGAAISHEIMSDGKHFTSVNFNGRTNTQVMAEIGVMRPLSLQRWTELRYGWNFIYRDRNIFRQMNGDRSNKWGGNMDMCSFDCLAGQCRWSNWREDETPFCKGTDIYTPHTHNSIDLLLDLDVGTLSYYSNQTFRGILKSGLKGEYVWFISLWSMNLVTETFSMRCSVF